MLSSRNLYRFLFIFLLLFLLSCAVNPVTHRKEFSLVSESQEIEIGRTSHKEIIEEFGYYDDVPLQSYVSKTGQELASVSHRRNLKFYFTVVDSHVVNAFALPGGYIYVTRGLLAELNSEAEMAGVIGHEIGHVTARHSARQITRATTYEILSTIIASIDPKLVPVKRISDVTASLIFLKYSRDDEREADKLGMEYALNAGYDPKPMASFLETLLRKEKEEEGGSLPGFLSTHPTTSERIVTVKREAEILLKGSQAPKKIASNAYKSHLDGLVYGPGEKDGVVEKEVYKNKFAGITLASPPSWKNQKKRLLFFTRHPQRNYLFLLRIHELKGDISLDAFVRLVDREMGLPPGSSQRVSLGGFHGVRKLYQRGDQKGGIGLSILYFLEKEKKIGYTLVSVAPLIEYSHAETYFTGIERSFRRLSPEEINGIKIRRIKIHTVNKEETFFSLSQMYYGGSHKAKDIAEFNGLSEHTRLLPGEKIKLILP